jgi:hypothetical protein
MYFNKTKFAGIFFALCVAPLFGAAAAKCKVQDLQKCLDSVCAVGIDLEPGERCYSCGTSAAKRPEKQKYALGDTPEMQALSIGKSSKNTISDKDLKKAPKDPGERYVWARAECVKKLKDCSLDDAAENYDNLIDQSCKIAMGDAEYAATQKEKSVKKTQEQCTAELSGCLLSAAKCGANMLQCEDDADFNRNFSACAADASGCGDFMTAMRDRGKRQRDDMVAKKNSRLDDLAKLRQLERQEKFARADKLCNSGGKDACMLEMCGNMPVGLDENGLCGDANEKIWAASLCKFVDIACDRLK